MAGFEDLIRGALAKQGNAGPQTREKVYESARSALTRMLEGNDALTPELVSAQQLKLEKAIEEIEAEHAVVSAPAEPAPTPAPPPSPSPVPPAPVVPPAAPEIPTPPLPEPVAAPKPIVSEPIVTSTAAPTVPTPAAVDLGVSARKPADPQPVAPASPPVASSVAPSVPQSVPTIPEPPVRLEDGSQDMDASYLGDSKRRERKPFAKLLLWAIILAGLGVAIWWSITNGPALLQQQLDGGVPNPGLTLSSGASTPGAIDEDGWVTAFAPQEDAQNVVTKGSGAAELQQDGNRPVMRLASPDAALTNNLLIKIPRGSMETLRGKSATFELVLRSAGDEDQSFVIFCEFASMGECGRKRFVAGSNPRPILFDVLINEASLAVGEDAFISINTDFDGNGRAIDLYSIRVRESS